MSITDGQTITINYHGRTYTGTVTNITKNKRGVCFLLNCKRSVRGCFLRHDGTLYDMVSL